MVIDDFVLGVWERSLLRTLYCGDGYRLPADKSLALINEVRRLRRLLNPPVEGDTKPLLPTE